MSQPVVLLATPVPEDLAARLRAHFTVVEIPPGESVAAAIDDAQRSRINGVLTSLRTRFDASAMDALPNLRVISNFAVGFDNVDIDAASDRGILVCNTPRVLDAAVADLTFGMLIMLGRNMLNCDAYVRDGSWASKGPFPLTRDIRGKTLGLLGMGRIGRMVARAAKAFDMKVIYHNRSRSDEAEGLAEYVERDRLFSESDFVSVHVPLTAETRECVGEREFGLMKSTAYLINTARGAVIDEAALVRALESATIAGAGLDVMVTEPLPADHPLCRLPNVVLQAHVGSATVETRRAMIDLATRNLIDALTGTEPEAMVNPQVWTDSVNAAV